MKKKKIARRHCVTFSINLKYTKFNINTQLYCIYSRYINIEYLNIKNENYIQYSESVLIYNIFIDLCQYI